MCHIFWNLKYINFPIRFLLISFKLRFKPKINIQELLGKITIIIVPVKRVIVRTIRE